VRCPLPVKERRTGGGQSTATAGKVCPRRRQESSLSVECGMNGESTRRVSLQPRRTRVPSRRPDDELVGRGPMISTPGLPQRGSRRGGSVFLRQIAAGLSATLGLTARGPARRCDGGRGRGAFEGYLRTNPISAGSRGKVPPLSGSIDRGLLSRARRCARLQRTPHRSCVHRRFMACPTSFVMCGNRDRVAVRQSGDAS
jgi:hypothetical protein